MHVSGLPSGDGYRHVLQGPLSCLSTLPRAVDLVATTDQTLPQASLHGLHESAGGMEAQEVRLLGNTAGHEGPLLRTYASQFYRRLCPHMDANARLRSRFVADLPRTSMYLVLAEDPEQLSHPDFQHAMHEILRQDGQGAIVALASSHRPEYAWRGVMSSMRRRLGKDGGRFFPLIGNYSRDEVDGFVAASNVILDPFPYGGQVETYAAALQACGDQGLTPIATLPSHQLHSQPAMAVYHTLLGDEALAELDPAAQDVASYVQKAMAFAQARAPIRRKLQNLLRKSIAIRPSYDEVLFEETVLEQVSNEVVALVRTCKNVMS